MPKKVSMAYHDFYCIKCGQKTLSLPRKKGHKHERFHRKKLYCPFCRLDINQVECQNDEDAFDFKEDFLNGVYINEAEDSMAALGHTGQW